MRVVASLLCLLAGPALAEGRNDPFLKCLFEDGREAVLAENGEAIEWLEGDVVSPVTVFSTGTNLPTRTMIADGEADGILRLDLLIDDAVAGSRILKAGTGLLSETVVGPDGLLTSISQSGTCEEFHG